MLHAFIIPYYQNNYIFPYLALYFQQSKILTHSVVLGNSESTVPMFCLIGDIVSRISTEQHWK